MLREWWPALVISWRCAALQRLTVRGNSGAFREMVRDHSLDTDREFFFGTLVMVGTGGVITGCQPVKCGKVPGVTLKVKDIWEIQLTVLPGKKLTFSKMFSTVVSNVFAKSNLKLSCYKALAEKKLRQRTWLRFPTKKSNYSICH